jgi:hypothetical protein
VDDNLSLIVDVDITPSPGRTCSLRFSRRPQGVNGVGSQLEVTDRRTEVIGDRPPLLAFVKLVGPDESQANSDGLIRN